MYSTSQTVRRIFLAFRQSSSSCKLQLATCKNDVIMSDKYYKPFLFRFSVFLSKVSACHGMPHGIGIPTPPRHGTVACRPKFPHAYAAPSRLVLRHVIDHDGRDRDFWSGMTEILVSDGQFFGASTIGGRFYWSI